MEDQKDLITDWSLSLVLKPKIFLQSALFSDKICKIMSGKETDLEWYTVKKVLQVGIEPTAFGS